MNPLPKPYYQHEDVVYLAKDLLGKKLCTFVNSEFTSGIITETEAYCGRNDRACHANDNKRTKRTEVMYHAGGKAYVYLCYGIHHLFNITTNKSGLADAILVRAIQPVDGVEIMLKRRNKPLLNPSLSSGPGTLSSALGITVDLYGQDLLGPSIWIEDIGNSFSEQEIVKTTRIGVDYAGEDALKPWRFYIKNSKWVSKP